MIWNSKESTSDSVIFEYISADGEENYPGQVTTTVECALRGNTIVLDYQAKSSKATPINLTNHSYFNLSGHVSYSGVYLEICHNVTDIPWMIFIL